MSRRPLFHALLLLASSATAGQPVLEIHCPTQISTVQKLGEPFPDWRESGGGGEHVLKAVSFSEGLPEDQAWLAPDNADRLSGKAWTAKWEFGASEEIWLTCAYRETTVTISQRLPTGIGRCSVRMDGSKAIEVQRVWCEK